eukprot:Awhi_evm1s14941
MVDVNSKSCLFEGCYKAPCCNYETETLRLYCVLHKLEGMVNIKSLADKKKRSQKRSLLASTSNAVQKRKKVTRAPPKTKSKPQKKPREKSTAVSSAGKQKEKSTTPRKTPLREAQMTTLALSTSPPPPTGRVPRKQRKTSKYGNENDVEEDDAFTEDDELMVQRKTIVEKDKSVNGNDVLREEAITLPVQHRLEDGKKEKSLETDRDNVLVGENGNEGKESRGLEQPASVEVNESDYGDSVCLERLYFFDGEEELVEEQNNITDNDNNNKTNIDYEVNVEEVDSNWENPEAIGGNAIHEDQREKKRNGGLKKGHQHVECVSNDIDNATAMMEVNSEGEGNGDGGVADLIDSDNNDSNLDINRTVNNGISIDIDNDTIDDVSINHNVDDVDSNNNGNNDNDENDITDNTNSGNSGNRGNRGNGENGDNGNSNFDTIEYDNLIDNTNSYTNSNNTIDANADTTNNNTSEPEKMVIEQEEESNILATPSVSGIVRIKESVRKLLPLPLPSELSSSLPALSLPFPTGKPGGEEISMDSNGGDAIASAFIDASAGWVEDEAGNVLIDVSAIPLRRSLRKKRKDPVPYQDRRRKKNSEAGKKKTPSRARKTGVSRNNNNNNNNNSNSNNNNNNRDNTNAIIIANSDRNVIGNENHTAITNINENGNLDLHNIMHSTGHDAINNYNNINYDNDNINGHNNSNNNDSSYNFNFDSSGGSIFDNTMVDHINTNMNTTTGNERAPSNAYTNTDTQMDTTTTDYNVGIGSGARKRRLVEVEGQRQGEDNRQYVPSAYHTSSIDDKETYHDLQFSDNDADDADGFDYADDNNDNNNDFC